MFNIFLQPVFADAGAVVGLLVLIFTVVGWLVNLANSQQNPPAKQKQGPRPRPQRDRVQNEIDIFLKEVRGEAPAEPDIVIESLPPETTRRRSRPTPPTPPTRPEPLPEAQRSRMSRVGSHVESHVGESLSTHHLESHFGATEPQPMPSPDPRAMGEVIAMQPEGSSAKTAPLPMIGMLKNRQGIRQAILVNEILSKPKALRDE